MHGILTLFELKKNEEKHINIHNVDKNIKIDISRGISMCIFHFIFLIYDESSDLYKRILIIPLCTTNSSFNKWNFPLF